MVCIALVLQLSTDDAYGKILCIWFPIVTSSLAQFEHAVADMTLLPLALFEHADKDVTDLAVLFPCTLGTIVGGGLFIGAFYYQVFLAGQEDQHTLIIDNKHAQGAPSTTQQLEMQDCVGSSNVRSQPQSIHGDTQPGATVMQVNLCARLSSIHGDGDEDVDARIDETYGQQLAGTQV
jgi:hypothetical protein